MQVTDGTNEFEIKKTQTTNDIELATDIRKRAAAASAADNAAAAAQQAILEKQQRDQVEFLRAHPLGGAPSATPK